MRRRGEMKMEKPTFSAGAQSAPMPAVPSGEGFGSPEALLTKRIGELTGQLAGIPKTERRARIEIERRLSALGATLKRIREREVLWGAAAPLIRHAAGAHGLSPEAAEASARAGALMVLPALCRREDIELKFMGTPKTNGRTIWLGPIDFSHPAACVYIFGHGVHERCHVLYTRFEDVRNLDPRAEHLTNLFEDIRVDALGERDLKGYRLWREALIAVLVRTGRTILTDTGPHAATGDVLCGWLHAELLTGILGMTLPDGVLAAQRREAQSRFGADFCREALSLVKGRFPLADTAAAAALADEFIEFIASAGRLADAAHETAKAEAAASKAAAEGCKARPEAASGAPEDEQKAVQKELPENAPKPAPTSRKSAEASRGEGVQLSLFDDFDDFGEKRGAGEAGGGSPAGFAAGRSSGPQASGAECAAQRSPADEAAAKAAEKAAREARRAVKRADAAAKAAAKAEARAEAVAIGLSGLSRAAAWHPEVAVLERSAAMEKFTVALKLPDEHGWENPNEVLRDGAEAARRAARALEGVKGLLPRDLPRCAAPGMVKEAKAAFEQAWAASCGFGMRFADLLKRPVPAPVGGAESGFEIDDELLDRAAVGDPRVFLTEAKAIDRECACVILTDLSGSMGVASGACVRVAALRLEEALRRTSRVKCRTAVFPNWRGTGPSIVSDWEDGLEKSATVLPTLASRGQTPLGPSLLWALASLLERPEAHKLLLVYTDGVFEPAEFAGEAALLRAAGVETGTVILKDPSVPWADVCGRGGFGGVTRLAESPDDLPAATASILEAWRRAGKLF